MLNRFHRVLIIAGIALGLICVLAASLRYLRQGDASLVPTGVAGALAAVGLSFYLRWFLAKHPRGERR